MTENIFIVFAFMLGTLWGVYLMAFIQRVIAHEAIKLTLPEKQAKLQHIKAQAKTLRKRIETAQPKSPVLKSNKRRTSSLRLQFA